MPPLAIIAAASVVGTGANIASSMSNAGAAKSAANTNAAAIRANQADNTGLLADLERGNQQAYDTAKGQADSAIQLGTQQGVDAFTGANGQVNDALNTAYGRANDATNLYRQQGQDLYGGTAQRGNDAGAAISALLGLGGDAAGQQQAFQNWLGSTGFKFALKTGADAVDANATLKGQLGSGGAAKALDQFGQQAGQTYFGNYLAGLQGQQSTGLTAANALSGVYSNVASMKTGAANTLAAGQSQNATNTANALSGLYTGQGSNLAGIAQNYASGLRGLQTTATGNLVSGNTASTNAMVGNTNNALAQTVSSNNSAANSISGLAGNLASGYGYSQGLSSYGGQVGGQNALSVPVGSFSGTPSLFGGLVVPGSAPANYGANLSSYQPQRL